MRELFATTQKIGDFVETREGLATADNERFLRHWHEVAYGDILFACPDSVAARDSGRRWFPYVKGGPYKKWYGNTDLVVNWQNDGEDIKANIDPDTRRVRSHNYNGEYAFRAGFTWSGISIAALSVRYVPKGFMFDAKGPMAFAADQQRLVYAVAVLNSEFGRHLMAILAPTVDFKLGHIMSVPADPNSQVLSRVVDNARLCIELTKEDWDRYETSWNCLRPLPLGTDASKLVCTVEDAIGRATELCQQRVQRLRDLEQENNSLLIQSYGLSEELSPLVSVDALSVRVPDVSEFCEWLVSYAIGCMMGRYSLDTPGLIYAQSGSLGFDPSQYKTFRADADGIIPLLETDWSIRDNAANRMVEFIGVAWPKERLEENLSFIADSLARTSNEQPRDTIRRYLATGFYKHHLSMYKRRPIYWLFSSGKQRAFQCLVYLHRYHEGTLARMRTEYVIPLQGQIASRIEQLEGDKAKATSTSHRRKLQKEQDELKKQQSELLVFEEKLKHVADQKISLDLDDGVKVNYGKFGDLLAESKAITGGTDDE